jgi:hypothetical protein
MHGPINVKSPNNISKWQMGFNSAFKRLTYRARDQNGTDTDLCQKLCESPEDGSVGPKHVEI